VVALLAATATMTACGGGGGGGNIGGKPGTETATSLVLIDVSVADFDGVALNQTILFEFSELLFPDSVRPDTIQIRAGPNYGKQVPGYFRVGIEEEGLDTRFVRFYPQLPTLPDLSDSGFQPGTPYRIQMPGVPQITTVRNYTGDRLMNETIVNFQTALTGSENLYIDNFLDPLIPGVSPGVSFVNPPDGATEVSTDNPIVLTFTRRPLNPATVNSTNITLTMVSRQGVPVGRLVPGTPVLEQSLERVTVTFQPTYPLADDAVYALHVDRRVEDLVGNDMAPFDSQFTARDEPWKSALLTVSFTEKEKYTIRDEDNTTAYWNEAVENALTALFTAAGGTGKSGDLTPTSNVTITPTNTPNVDLGVLDSIDGTLYDEFNFRKVDIPSGVTVRVLGNYTSSLRGEADPANHAVKILSLFPMNINGVLNVSGGNGDKSESATNTSTLPARYGGVAGPGGGHGANGYTGTAYKYGGLPGIQPTYGGYPGLGGGTSTDTSYQYGGGGGGAGNRTKGTDGLGGGYTYTASFNATGGKGGSALGGNLEREPNVGGSGGASGTTSVYYYYPYRGTGGGGGGGGGAVKLQSGALITIGAAGKVLADGGSGGATGDYYYLAPGAGGGGSGGSVKIASTAGIKFETGATVSVLGGAGGANISTYTYYYGGVGGNGGEGHIRLEAADEDDITGVAGANLTYKNPSTGTFLPEGGGAPSIGQTLWMNLGVFDPQMEEWKPGNSLHLRAETYGNDIFYYVQMCIEDESNPGNPYLEDLDYNDPDGGTLNPETLSPWVELSDLTDLNGYGYSFVRLKVVFQLKWNQKYTDVLPFVDHLGVPFRY
jgi:hypothetical protein